MTDGIYGAFLKQQAAELAALCASSSRLRCSAIQGSDAFPPNVFVVEITCAHLITVKGEVQRSSDPCVIAVQLPVDYLRRAYANAGQILSLVAPKNIFHPNARWPSLCSGPIAPGTTINELIMRCYEILTFNRFTPNESDCLNARACQWARAHLAAFPLENTPLRDLTASTPVDASGGVDVEVER